MCPGHSHEEIGVIAEKLLCAEVDTPVITELNDIAIQFSKTQDSILGVGRSRIAVGLCAEHVLKLEFINDAEVPANSFEDQVWAAAPPSLRRHLAPVFDEGVSGPVSWLLAGRCDEVNMSITTVQELESFASRVGGIDDLEYCNIGWYHDEMVIFDYAQITGAELTYDEEAPTIG